MSISDIDQTATSDGVTASDFENAANTVSRRSFLAVAGGATAASVLTVGPGVSAAFAASPKSGSTLPGTDTVLLTVFLRGAIDGLNLVVPFGDPEYYNQRTRTDDDGDFLNTIAVDTTQMPQLSDLFKFHPAASGKKLIGDPNPDGVGDVYVGDPSSGGLQALYESGDLAVIHAAGSTNSARSHFRAMDNMDYAFGTTGWLHGGQVGAGATEAHQGLSVGGVPSPSLNSATGPAPALPSVEDFQTTRQFDAERRRRLLQLYTPGWFGGDPELGPSVVTGFEVLDVINSITETDAAPGADYSDDSFACDLKNAAQLIKADVGCRAITVDYGKWDHHSDEAERLPPMLATLSDSLHSLKTDLGADWDRTTVVVMSEFGRTVAVNGAGGTDHGHGNIMLLAGGQVLGGQVYLRDGWRGLATENLYRDQDLWITTDFRDVFAEALRHQFGNASVSAALGTYTPKYLNIMGTAPTPAEAAKPKLTRKQSVDGGMVIGWAPSTGKEDAPGWAVGSVIQVLAKQTWETVLETSDTTSGEKFIPLAFNHSGQVRVAWRISGGGRTGWTLGDPVSAPITSPGGVTIAPPKPAK